MLGNSSSRNTRKRKRHVQEKTTASTDKLQVGVIYDNDPRIPRLACQVKGVRGESQGEFSLNEEIGQNAHLYIFFSSDDGLRFSPSQHVHVG